MLSRTQAVLTSILCTAKQQDKDLFALIVDLLRSAEPKLLDILPAQTDLQPPASPAVSAVEPQIQPSPETTAHIPFLAAGGQLDHHTPDSPGLPLPFAVTSGIASLPSRDHTVFI
jgi:hypothetical protein